MFQTENAEERTETFSAIAEAASKLAADSAIPDEVVAVENSAKSRNKLSPSDLGSRSNSRQLRYYAFDLLYFKGPICAARAERNGKPFSGHRYAKSREIIPIEPLAGRPADVYRSACDAGWPAIICKRKDAPYRSGRQDSWA
jgi:bifunctional non-homologous end joining protein LigD